MRSLASSKRLARWLEDHDEDVATIKVVGDYFDRDALTLKRSLPKKSVFPWLLGALGCTWLACLVIGASLFLDRGYFTVKESGHWFSATASEARGVGAYLFSERPRLTEESCRVSPLETGGFSVSDAAVICLLLRDPDVQRYIAGATQQQRIGQFILAALFAFAFGWVFLKMRQATHVWALHRRLREKTRQLELDFE